jgi:OPA family sugar phosphate sensor protein UhpC-like MFS transporter
MGAVNSVLGFFKTGPDAPPIQDAGAVRSIYHFKRWSVFLSILFGYSTFYVCRQVFSVTKKSMLDGGVLDANQMGNIGAIMLITYALGKFTNGFLADRANVRRFMPTGLLLVAAMVMCFGFSHYYILFLVLWALHGWFQSMGAVVCGVSLSQWFSNRERGRYYSAWSCSHSLGEGFSIYATALVVTWYGWRSGYFFSAAFAAIIALILYRTLADRPTTCGLPAVADFRNDHAEVAPLNDDSVGSAQREVFRNPYVWIVCFASLTMYVTRYGMTSWGPLYMQESKDYSLVAVGGLFFVAKIFETFGTFASGFISDLLFKSKRNVVTIVCCLFMVIGLGVFAMTPTTFVGTLDRGLLGKIEAGAVKPEILGALAGSGLYPGGNAVVASVEKAKQPEWTVNAPTWMPDWMPNWHGCRIVDAEGTLRVYKNYRIEHLIGASIYGMGIGCLIAFLGGLIAIDICSKKASGVAMGTVGLVSYIGATMQEKISGRLIEGHKIVVGGLPSHDFTPVMTFWFCSAVLCLILSCFLWNAKPRD